MFRKIFCGLALATTIGLGMPTPAEAGPWRFNRIYRAPIGGGYYYRSPRFYGQRYYYNQGPGIRIYRDPWSGRTRGGVFFRF